MTFLPHACKVLSVLLDCGMLRIEFEVILHALMYDCEIVGCFSRVAIATGLFASLQFGQATVEGDQVDIKPVQAGDEVVAPSVVFDDVIADHVIAGAGQGVQALVHAGKHEWAHAHPLVAIGTDEVHG